MASELEVKNADKVLSMLQQIDGITYERVTDDVFLVNETESGNGLSMTIDAEESVVCLIMDIMDIPENADYRCDVLEDLLKINDTAVHGKFCVSGSKILFKDNLEAENMDQNELEASMAHMFLTIAQNMEKLFADRVVTA